MKYVTKKKAIYLFLTFLTFLVITQHPIHLWTKIFKNLAKEFVLRV